MGNDAARTVKMFCDFDILSVCVFDFEFCLYLETENIEDDEDINISSSSIDEDELLKTSSEEEDPPPIKFETPLGGVIHRVHRPARNLPRNPTLHCRHHRRR